MAIMRLNLLKVVAETQKLQDDHKELFPNDHLNIMFLKEKEILEEIDSGRLYKDGSVNVIVQIY